jgi:RNA polymerase sigma-70 factor (ECF subfamily)
MREGGEEMEPNPGEITVLLHQIKDGDQDAQSRLIGLVYPELRRLAADYMRQERPDHTLQTTALVHEAYLRFLEQKEVGWQSRSHFFGVAATLMRRILVDHARERLAKRRGGSREKLTLDDASVVTAGRSDQLLALDEALGRLEETRPRQSRIVELRFFGGLSEEEVAEVLGISTRTVRRDWNFAKAWLYQQIGK